MSETEDFKALFIIIGAIIMLFAVYSMIKNFFVQNTKHDIRMDNLQKCYDEATSQKEVYECDYTFGTAP